MKKVLPVIFLLVVVLAACKKTEDVNITGNVPPPDKTIDSSTIVIYINKSYINLLGRKPVGNEQATAMAQLRGSNFSVDNRKLFIQSLFSKPGYNRNLYVVADIQYLRSTDSTNIAQQLNGFKYQRTLPQYAEYYDYFDYEIVRLDTLTQLVQLLDLGVYNYRDMLKRFMNNYFYDQINMGTQNFVVSGFQNFLFRYPTNSELSEAENVVNGFQGTVFLQTGNNKEDYINMFFNSNDYYEGQVRFIYRQYLFREPTSDEIGYYSNLYKTTGDYKQLQTAIFSLNEYAGIK